MAVFDHAMVPRDGSIIISDNASAISMTVPYEEGNFQFSELGAGYMDVLIVKSRGIPMKPRYTEVKEVEFSFDCIATDFTDAVEKLITDAILKRGAWAGAVSTLGATADVFTLTCKFQAEQTNYGAGADSSLLLKHCMLSFGFAEGLPGKFSIKGKAILLNTSTDIVWG